MLAEGRSFGDIAAELGLAATPSAGSPRRQVRGSRTFPRKRGRPGL
jgi:hypothetical protein